MRKYRKFIVKHSFESYLPKTTDFAITEEAIPALKNGEFLVKAEYISVDPYLRSFASEQEVPYLQFGFQVGKVVESKNKDFALDTYVVSHSSWSDYVVLDGAADEMFGIKPYRTQVGNLHPSLAVGALGMPGMTAYLGFLEICRPKKRDIVCVTSGAGAVGSLVGQIARLKGCVVIGLAGSDDKVQILKNDLGFHHAFNYKTEANLKENLMSLAPKGINCFFDNVGGTLAAVILACMSDGGRVAVCGSISTYGRKATRLKSPSAGVQIEAFSFTQWDWPIQLNAVKQMKEWIEKGSVKAIETVTNDFEQLPTAFIRMLKGKNVGKAVVKV